MMIGKRVRLGLVVASLAALGGCADGYYGGGYGGGVGYASSYYSGPYGYGGDYYGGLGYPSYGLYNNFYYPGYGSYVFDRGGHRRGWNDDERGHWQHRGEYRGNHLMQNGRFDARRDRAYAADRGAGFRNFRQGGGVAGQNRGAGGGRGVGRPGGGGDHRGGEGRHP